jgi:hypothetical protein
MVPVKRQLGCLAVALVVAFATAGRAGAEADGMVIRVMDHLLFIDSGQRQGVQQGDLFNILSTNIISHPITGDTLAVAPKNVGAIRVLQVYEKMSLSEVIHLNEGADPMLMQISRVKDPMRLQELESYTKRRVQMASSSGVSPWLGVVPGLYQIRLGAPVKGWIIIGVQAVTLGTAITYRLDSNDWLDQYKALPETSSQFDFYFNEASDRRRTSNRLFWLAGAVYAYNLIDSMWMGGRTTGLMASRFKPRWKMGLGLDRNGHTLV